jgi:uncharacterized protein with FMN-binding domain
MSSTPPPFLRRAWPALAIGAVAVGIVSQFDSGAAALVGATKTPSSGTTGTTTTGPASTATNKAATKASTSCVKSVGPTVPITEFGRNFGDITVTAWVKSGSVCKVSTSYNAYDGRSQMIDQQVVPMMDQQVAQTKNANISTISGATYSSQAYITSLQSAIQKA